MKSPARAAHRALLALSLILAAPSWGQTPNVAPPSQPSPTRGEGEISQVAPPTVVQATLKNGMHILLLERHGSPTIAFHMMFKVGSVDEEQGQTGLAHMFEHMIFKGTKRLYSRDWNKEKPALDAIEQAALRLLAEQEKGERADPRRVAQLKTELEAREKDADQYVVREEYEKLYEMNGAHGLNAYTGEDRTAYLVELPSNRLEFWMAMEAERLRDPVLREFYKERDVVMEERRMRVDADPMGKLWEEMISAAYEAHPYGHDVIGWMSDLKALSRTDAERFFDTHYGPNSATAVLVGDLDPQATLAMFRKYFEPIPPKPLAKHHITAEPEQRGPRRVDVAFEAEPLTLIAWHKPSLPARDDTALQMLRAVLADGRTSRFYRNLVEGKKVALSASADAVGVGERYPNLFVVWGESRHPHTAAEVEAGLLAEIEKLKREPPTEWELDKVRNQLTAGLVKELESNHGMATKLAYYQTIADDWRYPWELQRRFQEITPKDVQDAAVKYLTAQNSTTATLVKPTASEPETQISLSRERERGGVRASRQASPSPRPSPPTGAREKGDEEVLEFEYGAGSAALGAAARQALRDLAARAAKVQGARLGVTILSLASEDAKVTQRRGELALATMKEGGLAAERVDLKAEKAPGKPGIKARLER